ncbi:MAG: sporulation protein YqfD [Clostridiales bacterium]|nr:sporulation protein YqfD [Clostridiales bacterium]
MLFLRLWNYLLGYLVIRVEGLSLERFINLTISKGIYMWDIDRYSYTAMTACINIYGFKRLKKIVRTTRCSVRILDKRGLPFVLNRFKHRKMLVIGLTVFLIIIYGLSSFIWIVEIEGAVKVSETELLQVLAKHGIMPGAYKRGLDTSTIANKVIIDMPGLWWVSIQIKGTKALVRVVETTNPPPMLDRSIPCNIVAAKDGIISEMVVLEGEPVVEVGETVRKGQLLVSGVIEDQETHAVRYVHAMAQVNARTWYEGNGTWKFNKAVTKRTGKKIEHKFLDLGKWVVELQKKEIPFKKYEVEEKRIPFIDQRGSIPIALIVREYYEVEELKSNTKLQDAKTKAYDMAYRSASKKVPENAKVVDKKVKYDIIENIEVKATVYLEAIEDIAVQQTIYN